MGNFSSIPANADNAITVDIPWRPSEVLLSALVYFFDVPSRKQSEFKNLLSKLNFESVRRFFSAGSQIIGEGDILSGLFVSITSFYILKTSCRVHGVILYYFYFDR